jgi:signal peptidase I
MAALAGLLGAGAFGAICAVLRIRFVIIRVSGDSMLPALRHGDRVLVRRTSFPRLRRGQIVVFAPPKWLPFATEDPPWLIKRIEALPGDAVPSGVPVGEARDGRVPSGHFVAFGDNAVRSYDSRRTGFFPAEALLGVLVRRMLG